MKKLIILAILLTNVCGFGQGLSLDINNNTTTATVPSGTMFILNISASTGGNCTNFESIIVDIGDLVYVANNGYGGLQYDGFHTVTVDVAEASQAIYNIPLQFAEGITCNNAQRQIRAHTNCDPNNEVVITVIAQTANSAGVSSITASIPGSTSGATSVCYGQLVKYTISSTFPQNNYNIIDPRINFRLAKCAKIVSVYRDGTTLITPPTYISDQSNNTRIHSWPMMDPTFTLSDDSHIPSFDVYVRYGCEEGVNCTAGTYNTPKAWLNGNYPSQVLSQNCTTPSYTQANPVQFTHTFDCVIPYSCTSIGEVATLAPSSYFTCFSNTCNNTSYAGLSITLPEGYEYSATHPFEVILTVPDNLFLNTQYAATLPSSVSISYLYEGASTFSNTLISTQEIKKIKWFSTTIVGVASLWAASYFLPPSINIPLPITMEYSMTNPDGTQITGSYDVYIGTCNPQISTSLKIKNVTAGATQFLDESAAVPGHNMRFRLTIYNYGAGDIINPIITQALGPNFIYNNNLKYIFSNDYYATPVNDLVNGMIVDPNMGSATVTDNSGVLTIEHTTGGDFKLPLSCTNPNYILVIEFDATVKFGLPVDTIITNHFNVQQTNPFYSVNSSDISVKILSAYRIGSKMSTRCHLPVDSEWAHEANVKNGELVDFKMVLTNEGSEKVYVKEILNQRPQVGDQFEFVGVNTQPLNRNSQFSINFDCGIAPQILKPTNMVDPDIIFGNGYPSMTRGSLLYPTNNSGTTPNWTPGTCDNNNASNWLNISFPATGSIDQRVLLPGQTVEVIYTGKVNFPANTVGSKAFNSFSSMNFYGANADYHFNSNNSLPDEMAVINITAEGCVQDCVNCSSFALAKDEKYLVSGWVKEESKKEPNLQYKTYENSFVRLTFFEDNGVIINTPLPIEFYPSGQVIDGWQRIVGEFMVPAPTVNGFVGNMKLELVNNNTDAMSYFDDIRIIPSKGNMKSYVYDQKTQRLMAELDENNYSTFYEYDLEGGLIRIKKETEKGVFTIQETRSGNTKNKKP